MPMPNAPVPPDYTQLLDRIVEILGRTQTPQSAFLLVGWLLGILSTVFVAWMNNIRDRRKIRRALYREMAKNYFELARLRERMMMPQRDQLIRDTPREVLEFGAVKFAKRRRDVSEGIKEVMDIETMYDLFRRSRGLSIETQATVFELNPVLEAFENRVGTAFNEGLLMKVSPPPIGDSIKRTIADRSSNPRP